ncbi:MAG TPA: RDD family protein [Candidatus Glassbacteria bacterium]|nr:RDD family protein [Candidatus Glassbacteria bacterium]
METFQNMDFNHWILRFIALVIDSLIISVVAWILWSFLFVSLLFTGALYTSWLGFENLVFYPLVVGVLEVLYFAIFDLTWGATLGKRFLGLQVQTVNGGKVAFDKAIIRNISKIYWILLLLDWLIAIFTPGDDKRQKYSDRIARTTVVQISQAFASTSSVST